jgi:hypothetical protein
VTAGPTPTRTSSGPDARAGTAGAGGRRGRLVVPAIGAVALGLGLLWLAVAALRFSEGAYVDGVWEYVADDAWAFDLEAYVGAALRLGTQGTLYDAALMAGPFEPGPADLFYYAPPLGVAMLPFTGLPIHDSSVIWYVLRVAALLAACALMPVRPTTRVLAFGVVALSWPVLKDAVLGNVSILLLLPLVMAWRWLDRPVGSLALAAAMAVRPSLGVFLLWQLLRRRWRAAAWTVAGGLGIIVLTLPFVGVDGYLDYVAVLGNLNVPQGASENRDLGGVAIMLGASGEVVTLARAASVLIAGMAVLLSLRRDREVGFMVTLMASLLLVPLLWDHYLATLLLPAAFLADRLRLVAILLPLLAWLPGPMLAGVVLAAMLLPFLVRDARPGRTTLGGARAAAAA